MFLSQKLYSIFQYLKTRNHLSRKRYKINNITNLIPSVHNNLAIVVARTNLSLRQGNNSRGKSFTTEEVIRRKYVLKAALKVNISMG